MEGWLVISTTWDAKLCHFYYCYFIPQVALCGFIYKRR